VVDIKWKRGADGWPGNAAAIAAVVVIGVVAARPDVLGDKAAPPKLLEAPAPLLDPAQQAKCEKALDAATKAGIIRARPSPTRIDVEDWKWAGLPADLKKRTLAAVSCAALGRWAPAKLSEGPVVAYGYRSGQRMAMLTEVGFSFE
jgi:hypothetical protein